MKDLEAGAGAQVEPVAANEESERKEDNLGTSKNVNVDPKTEIKGGATANVNLKVDTDGGINSKTKATGYEDVKQGAALASATDKNATANKKADAYALGGVYATTKITGNEAEKQAVTGRNANTNIPNTSPESLAFALEFLPEPLPPVQRQTVQRTLFPGAFSVAGIGRGDGASVASQDDFQDQQQDLEDQHEVVTNDTNINTDGLATANPVTEEDPQSHAVPEEEAAKRQRKAKLKTYVILTVLLFLVALIVALAVSLTVVNSSKSSAENPTESPSASPSQAPTTFESDLRGSLLSIFPSYTVAAIQQRPRSPQMFAFEWLMEDPLIRDLYPAPYYQRSRIRQRFALATLYFATNGPQWTNNNNWLNYSVHECEWYSRDTYSGAPKESYGITRSYNDSEIVASGNYPCPQTAVPTSYRKYEHLWLKSNALAGMLPQEVYFLTSLKTISLSGNSIELKGTISSHIGLLTNFIAIDYNGLSKSSRHVRFDLCTFSTCPNNICYLF